MLYKWGFCVSDWDNSDLLHCTPTLFHIVIDLCHSYLLKVEEIEETRYETTA